MLCYYEKVSMMGKFIWNTLKGIFYRFGPRERNFVNRFRYTAGMLPRVNRKQHPNDPHITKPTILITADFELAWGLQHIKELTDPRAYAESIGEQGRKNLPILLSLFEEYRIPVNWAIVGHLFLETCMREEGVPHPEIPRIPYFENMFAEYKKSDWFMPLK